MKENSSKKILTIVLILSGLFIISLFTAMIFSFALFGESLPKSGNVALIPLKGVITTDGQDLGWGESGVSSTEIVEFIEEVEKDDQIKAIVFEIDSPGGSAVASKEIADAIRSTKKPTVAVIRELGASGAYWSASATDHIIADELSITGSIGVLSSYLEFSGLMEKYGVKYQQLTAGKYKDSGSPFKSLSLEEELMFQSKIDKIHQVFIYSVAQNRKIDPIKVKQIADGNFYLGMEAKELGLVDELGNKKSAEIYLKQKYNLTEITYVEYEHEDSLFEIFSELKNQNSFFVGKGIASQFTNQKVSIRT